MTKSETFSLADWQGLTFDWLKPDSGLVSKPAENRR